ncbi:unnamed protein product [Rotaria sordida]|uniref:Uncharacterized protein n=1 Tax=Rotaria sordida TaxID=392033 RepID=A0A819S2I2_9BILA|nr:unnamed protein product [Rotaria sordida]CAF1118322.1 unnamed protein product [Rotaria sordida]CAF4050129.1 unnamed protein product [Rotaria sordida]
MNDENNDLWSYSAKIFTIIDNKHDLTSILKENLGILPSKNEFEQLNQSLEMTNNSKRKIPSGEKFNIAQMISLIVWIKYYAQLYAFALINES